MGEGIDKTTPDAILLIEKEFLVSEEIKLKLKNLSMGLMKFHKSLIDLEFARIEQEQKSALNPTQKLNLLLHDPSLEWLRPLSQLISAVDELYYKKNGPITSDEVDALKAEGQKVITALKIASTPDEILRLLKYGQAGPTLPGLSPD